MKLKSLSFASVLILLFSGNALAFSDNFNDGTFNAWNYNTPGWSISSGSYDGSNYAHAVEINPLMYANLTGTQTNWSAVFKTNPTSSYYGYFYFRFSSKANTCYLRWQGSTATFSSGGIGSCSALANINYNTASPNYWYRVYITDLDTTLKFQFLNATTGIELKNYTISDVAATGNNVALQPPDNADDFLYDDIVVYSISPNTPNSITWGSDNYVKDDVGSFSWVIKDSDWTDTYIYVPYSFRAEIYKNADASYIGSWDIGSQTGTGYFTFPDVASYTVVVNKYILIDNFITTDTTSVRTTGTPYISVNSTIPVGSQMPFNIQFLWGFTPANPTYSGISIWKLADDGNYYQSAFKLLPQFGLSSITATTLYTVNMSVYNEGVYEIRLEDYDKGVIAKATTKAKAINYPGSMNITTPWLDILGSYYYPYGAGVPLTLNQGMRVNYGIDGINYTTKGYKFYIRTYSFDKNTYIGETSIYQQIGDNVYILSLPTLPDAKRFGNELDVITGNNSLRLVGRNTTTEVIIDSENFTISDKDSDGYGITLSKYEACTKESIGITVYSPDPSLLTVYKTREGYSNLRDVVKTYRINATTGMNLMTSFPTAGNYAFVLTKFDNTTIDRDLSIINCATPTPTPTATTSTSQQTSAIADLLSSNIFWALIFTAGFMVMVAFATSQKKE